MWDNEWDNEWDNKIIIPRKSRKKRDNGTTKIQYCPKHCPTKNKLTTKQITPKWDNGTTKMAKNTNSLIRSDIPA